MTRHLYLALLTLVNVGLQVLTHLRPEHVLLGPLLDSGQVPPVVGMMDHLHPVPDGLGDHSLSLKLHIVLSHH